MDNKLISEDYVDLLVENESLKLYEGYDTTFLTFVNSIVHLPREQFNKCSIGTFPYYIFPSILALESLISLDASGIQRIQNNPVLGLFGSGVLIGVVDTGIEYQHQAFLNSDGSSKIVSIWDQTINDDTLPPQGFYFGTEYNNTTINRALQSADPLSIVPSQDEIGHGTMLSGIIAGNPNASANFSGIVPNSELVIVKLKQAKQLNRQIFAIPPDKICYQETDIIFGINYLLSVAQSLNRPMAICIALGTNQSGHDGLDVLSRYCSYVTRLPEIGFAISAGNEGNSRRHYKGLIEARQPFVDFSLRVGENEKGFSMELWQNVPYRLSINITSPTGENTSPVYPALNECRRISFIFEPSVLWINNFIFESESGDQLILLRFENPQPGIWRFQARNLDETQSEFNVWLPSDNLISDETFFLDPDPNITITSPGNSYDPLTVTAYDPESGSIAIFSSRGYTRTNVIKPDLAAPGVNLTCPTLNNSYGSVSGTGAATAHTVGIIAMILEWAVIRGNYTTINGFDIKQLLIRGAERSTDIVYPNNIWGYGKVDIYGVFRMLIS